MKHFAVLIMCLVMLLSPVVANPTPVSSSQFVEPLIDSWLSNVRDQSDRSYAVQGVEIYHSNTTPLPPDAAAGVSQLLDIVSARHNNFPVSGMPVRVYVLPYSDYRQAWNTMTNILDSYGFAVGSDLAAIRTTHGFFVPVQSSEYAIIVYEWSWYIMIHELVHHSLTVHIGPNAGMDHSLVIPETNRIWLQPNTQQLMDSLIEGQD